MLKKKLETTDNIKPCRVCGAPLPPGGTRRIGVCSQCVASPKYNRIKIPGPKYGRVK